MEPPRITTSVSSDASILTEVHSMAKSASFASVHKVPSQPKKEEEELREEPQTVSAEGGVREEVEDEASKPSLPRLSSSEHKTKSKEEEEVSSPRVDESVEYTFEQHGDIDMETMSEEIQEEVPEVAAVAEEIQKEVPKVAAAADVKSNESKEAEVPLVDDNIMTQESAEQSTEPDADKAKLGWVRSAFLCGIDKTICCAAPNDTTLDGVDMENPSVPSAEQPSELVAEAVCGEIQEEVSKVAAAADVKPNKSKEAEVTVDDDNIVDADEAKPNEPDDTTLDGVEMENASVPSAEQPSEPVAEAVSGEESIEQEFVALPPSEASVPAAAAADAPSKSWMEKLKMKRKKMNKKLSKKLSLKRNKSRQGKKSKSKKGTSSYKPAALPVIAEGEVEIEEDGVSGIPSVTKDASVTELSIKTSASAGKDDGKEEETVVEETRADDLPLDLESMSLDLATMSSTLAEDKSVVGQLEAKLDLYKQKYGLIQKFGNSLDQLKKKKAEVKAKESEIKEKELEIEKCTTVKKLKKKKTELTVLESELAGLKTEEEAIQRHVTRLHELLNAQLEQKRAPPLSSSGSEETSNSNRFATKNFFQRIASCTAPVAEDENDGGATDTDKEEDEEETVQEHTMDRVLDVVCGIHH